MNRASVGVSEFSMVLAALGVSLGHIDHEVMGLITLVGLMPEEIH